MKNFTINKKSLLIALPLLCSLGTNAQIYNADTNTSFLGLHRSSSLVGDYNNDGRMDVYYGGETWLVDTIAWQVQGILQTQNADGTFTQQMSNIHTPTYTANGTFDAHGLPPSTYSFSRFRDFNNDGNLDFIVTGRSDNDLQIQVNPDGTYVWLYKNGGAATDYNFTQVTDVPFRQSDNNGRATSWGAESNSTMTFGDYNKDGYIDMAVTGQETYKEGEDTKYRRFVDLYKNNGDGTFTRQLVFNPIEYSKNPAPTGLVNIYETTFAATPTMEFKPMSGGAVMFGDLNGDGWLDLVGSGYADGSGGVVYIYKNNGDGTFQEVDLTGKDITPVYESDITMADFNNDGNLDMAIVGTPNTGNKIGDIYFNTGAGDFTFTHSSVEGGNGLYGCSAAVLSAVDINNDGMTDLITSGWTNVNDAGWGTRIFFQNADNTFTLQDNSGLPYFNSGGFFLGDIYGHNTMDIAGVGYDGGCFAKIYKSSYESNTTPEAPTKVAAVIDGSYVKVTWDAAKDNEADAAALSYNVYAKNLETGAISMILPADTATGKLKSIYNMQTAVRGEANLNYTVKLGKGSYKIGVQTIDPSFATSKFATTTLVLDDISDVNNEKASVNVEAGKAGIIAKSVDGLKVTVFNASGTAVAAGETNKLIPFASDGIFIVKVGDKVVKVTK